MAVFIHRRSSCIFVVVGMLCLTHVRFRLELSVSCESCEHEGSTNHAFNLFLSTIEFYFVPTKATGIEHLTSLIETTMADLLPSLSSEDEASNRNEESDEEEDGVDQSFKFGGILGEDGGLNRIKGEESTIGWSYQKALSQIQETEDGKPQRMDVADLIAAKRRNKTVKRKEATEEENGEENETGSENESESESEEEEESNEEHETMEEDQLKVRMGGATDDGDDESSDDEDQEEAAKAAVFFDDQPAPTTHDIKVFAQLTLSRPLLRGIAAMGFVQPTPIQAACIPIAMQGKDLCASAVTGSGKTAAFCLPVMERLLHFQGGRIRAVILTPTRELAAQCLGMLTTLAQFTKLRATLITGGSKNSAAQAADLRSRPDFVVATPGRLLDHVTNTPGVTLEDVEFLILDECDRLLDLGFQDEVHEIVKACPVQRQTLLFSATLTTGVDDLISLSLKRPIRVRISEKQDGKDLEVAPRLEQEFVRIQSNNEGVNRQGILMALLARTFSKQTIVFFDTKVVAHKMMILCGLCGISCAELHGNLTQQQRLQALEDFTQNKVDILLATDLAARGLDVKGVKAVINYEMPSQIETYIHRIGRTARAGRSGRSCTLIGEGRRHLMKDLLRDAAQKQKSGSSQGLIRTRSLPPAVVTHFVHKIQSLADDLSEILQAETVAKMDRIAEMEAIRATNILQHSDEIKARPAREWFATQKQKENTRKTTLERKQRLEEQAHTGTHRMTRKKRRAREARDAMDDFSDEEDDGPDQAPPKKSRHEVVVKTAARAAKRQISEKEQDYYSKSLHDIDVAKEKKKLKRRTKDASGDSSLFDDEKVTYSQPKKTKAVDEVAKSAYDFRGYDPNHKMGKKKGNKAFKSKSKHKRRK
jgi:ATP-dependent RNA helicase DDX27